jgi:hypothetical protein
MRDIIGSPKQFQIRAAQIVNTTFGLAKYLHPIHYSKREIQRRKQRLLQQQQQQRNNNNNNITTITPTPLWEEFEMVLALHKDLPHQVAAAKQWLLTQLSPLYHVRESVDGIPRTIETFPKGGQLLLATLLYY